MAGFPWLRLGMTPLVSRRALAFMSLIVGLINFSQLARAQDNYEIQVYGSELVPVGTNMLELHSNFTAEGSKQSENGLLPTQHAFHETLEFTHGFTPWFETGFYVFTSARSGAGWQWVGDHIRPRFSVPEEWHWPVGLSLSNEIGYQRPSFSPDSWSWEIRPIIDKQIGPWYLSFNPAFERALRGPDVKRGFEFSPAFKVSYDITKQIAGGIEYYGSWGPATNLDPSGEQQHQIFPTIDLNVSPDWEINFGVGFGLTHSADHLIAKLILGRRF